MAGTMRAHSLALASAAAICAIALPTAARVADDLTTHIGELAPSEPLPLVDADAKRIEPELTDSEAPISETPASGAVTKPPSLSELVHKVSEIQDIRLTGELRCLAGAIYQEARGESIEGQLAVAQVILNRSASRHWPDNLCGVIYQQGQFSYTFDGLPDYPRTYNANWKRAEAIAIIASTGAWRDVTSRALYFHATHASPAWMATKELTLRIGQHVFYR